VHARELQRDAHRRRAARAEEHAAEVVGRQLDELLRQRDCRPVRVPPRAEGKRVELRLDRGDHVRVAEAHLMHAVAMEVHNLPSLGVAQVDALGALERVHARRGQRLVQKYVRVLLEQRDRLFIQVLGLPFSSSGAQVDVTFGSVQLQLCGAPCT